MLEEEDNYEQIVEDELANDLQEFDSDGSDAAQKQIEQDVRSITSTAANKTEYANGTIDEKLLYLLTDRSYESVVKEVQERALKSYNQYFTAELNPLLQNHVSISNEYGTTEKSTDDWQIDTESATDEELAREVKRLSKKLNRISNENQDIEHENNTLKEKLSRIYDQNEALSRLAIE